MRKPKSNCDKCHKKLKWIAGEFKGHLDAAYLSEVTGQLISRNRVDKVLIASCCGYDYLHEE